MIPEQLRWLGLRSYQLALLIALICITLQYMGLSEQLSYQRSLVASGQWWRLLSGNFVHLGSSHLWMNLAGLALVVSLVWSHFSFLHWLVIILLCSVGVGTGLWFFNPEVEGYVGFSGTLHGLIIAGTVADFRSYPRSAAILLALVVAKLIWEQVAGALPGSEATAGGMVLVDSHLYGAICGAIVAPVIMALNHRSKLFKSRN